MALLQENADVAYAARSLANELFRQAMQEMRELADSLSHHGRTFEFHARRLRGTKFPWDC